MLLTTEQKCERAFERRFGQSLMLSTIRPRSGVVKVFDVETGSWAEYDVTAWRIRRLTEYDAAT